MRGFKRDKLMLIASQRAFTLMELLLVLLIIGILAAMVIPRMAGRSQQARASAAKADIESNLSIALDLYELDNGTYPSTQQGLEALITKPVAEPAADRWNGPYIKNARLPVDPWGNAYKYTCPGINNPLGYDLSSFGPDKREGTEDDLVNWRTGEIGN